MNAVAATAPKPARKARKPLTPERLKHIKDALKRQLERSFRDEGSYRCVECRSRVEIAWRYDANNQIVGSTGKCRTAGCITWED